MRETATELEALPGQATTFGTYTADLPQRRDLPPCCQQAPSATPSWLILLTDFANNRYGRPWIQLEQAAVSDPCEQVCPTTADWSGRPESCYGLEGRAHCVAMSQALQYWPHCEMVPPGQVLGTAGDFYASDRLVA
jgi:hypothetical protein